MYINNDIDYLKYLKKKENIIFGAGEQGRQGYYRLQKEGIKIIAFCDNDKEKQEQLFCDEKVLSFKEICEINNENIMIIICSNYEREIKEQLLDHKIYNYISISQIDFGGGSGYYDERYFIWQKSIGEFGGKINAKRFKPYIKSDMVVVEFGSGGGYLLDNLLAKEKIGIEINDTAREEAQKRGIHSVKKIEEIPNNYADIIISTHVLEHVENPFGALQEMRNKLKDNGTIVFAVPNESCETEYCKSENNNHIYTWNCLNLGNLFKAAGYFVQSVENVKSMWPKHYFEIEKEISEQFFETICDIEGKCFNNNSCMIVACK